MLPFWIAGAQQSGVTNIVVICDLHRDDEKSKRIFEERTGDAFELSDKERARIYTGEGKPIPFYFVENHNSETLIQLTQFLGIDCLFNAGTPRRISAEIISSMRNGIINIHPGLLPEHRGCTPVEWAIYNDDKVGNTAHFMDEGYDTGPIIISEWYEFPSDVDYQSIRTRVYRDGSILAGKVLASIQNSELKVSDATLQDNERGKYWKVIPDDKMKVVLNKLQSGEWKYQSI